MAVGYLERVDDPTDARRRLVRVTRRAAPTGYAARPRISTDCEHRWTETLGPERVAAMEDDLGTMASANWFRLDVPGWFGG